MQDPIAAIATGAQVAAIGILRLSGPGSIQAAARLFTPAGGGDFALQPARKLIYGRLCRRDGSLLDLCLATLSRAPNSYTGEDTVELQCHGSPLLLRTALEELFALGLRQARPGEFTKRAFLNGRLDLSQAEAVADLIDAESDEALRNASGQLSGAIGRRIEQISAPLTGICAHFGAVLDYPDEDIEPFELASYRQTIAEALGQLRRLSESFGRGRLLNTGIPTVLLGAPNAGKSSLLNALLGYERAIVTPIPGTTRDTIEERVQLGRLCLRLIDTAGLRESADAVERLGVQRSREALRRAELALVLVDGSREPDAEDRAALSLAAEAPRAIAIRTKLDLGEPVGTLETPLPELRLSARTGAGFDTLTEAVEALFPAPEGAIGEILTNARQKDAVDRAAASLAAALTALDAAVTPDAVLTEVEAALAALGELTGRSVREDVTEQIFRRFCVGK